MDDLARRIEAKIREIPARNSMYIAPQQETLGRILSPATLREIAKVAAQEAATDVSGETK